MGERRQRLDGGLMFHISRIIEINYASQLALLPAADLSARISANQGDPAHAEPRGRLHHPHRQAQAGLGVGSHKAGWRWIESLPRQCPHMARRCLEMSPSRDSRSLNSVVQTKFLLPAKHAPSSSFPFLVVREPPVRNFRRYPGSQERLCRLPRYEDV